MRDDSGRFAPEPYAKTWRFPLRIGTREEKLLERLAAKSGMPRNDYLMLLAGCKPVRALLDVHAPGVLSAVRDAASGECSTFLFGEDDPRRLAAASSRVSLALDAAMRTARALAEAHDDVQLCVPFDAGTWLAEVQARLDVLARRACIESSRYADDVACALSTRYALRTAPRSESPRRLITVRSYPSERDRLDAAASEFGMNRNDYLMLMLSAQPIFKQPECSSPPLVDSCRRDGWAFEGPEVYEGAADLLLAFLEPLCECLLDIDDSLHAIESEARQAQDLVEPEAAFEASLVDEALAQAEDLGEGAARSVEALTPTLRDVRGRRIKNPRVFFSDKRGALFPKEEGIYSHGHNQDA